MEGNTCASPRRAPPTKGPRRSNLVYTTMAVAHEGLASLAVDLHEVGDLLALTTSLVLLGNVAEIQNFLRITKINLWSHLATRERGVHLHTLVDRARKRSRERG